MREQTKLAVATAIAGGYVLGRTKNGRLALTVAAVVAGRGLGRGSRELAAEGVRRLGDVPKVGELQDQFRGQGVEAARNALSAVADRGIGSLADAIGERATTLGEKGAEQEEEVDESPKQEEEEAEEAEDADSEGDEGDEEEEPPSAKRRRPTRASGTRPGAKKKAPAKKKAADKKAPAKKAAPTKRAAKETASSRSSRRR